MLPNLSPKEIANIAEKEYGMMCSEIRQIHGYVDKNYWLKEKNSRKEYVLRTTSKEYFIQEAANEIETMKEHLFQNSFKVSCFKKTVSGCRRISYISEDQTLMFITISEFLPGKTIAETNLNENQLREIASDVGTVCGLMTECLQKYWMQKVKSNIWDAECVWYTENFYKLKQYVEYVPDESLKLIICNILEEFKNEVHPLLPKLQSSFLHGDFSNTNIVLIDGCDPRSSVKERYGIIDFENAHEGPLIFDLTICMAYMMTNTDQDFDKLAISKAVLKKYQKSFRLTEEEKDVIFWGVLARLITSYVMSFYFLSKSPANIEYLQLQSSKCPKIIKTMWDKGKQSTMDYWLGES